MRLKIGSWYYFKFGDHSKGCRKGDELFLELCGQVESISDTHIHVIYWSCISSSGDSEVEDENHERASILISSIVKKKKLIV